MNPPIGVRVLAVGVFAVLTSVLPSPAQQVGAIQGEVYDAMNGQPLSNVIATVPGTKIRAMSDSLGMFRLDNVQPGEVTVRLQRNGYAGIAEAVVVDGGWTSRATFEMAPIAIMLDALRVHAGGKPLGASSAAAEDETREGTGSTVEKLGTHIPGVFVMKPSGEVGRGSRIVIRGPGSLSLSNLPAVYVDGVRVQAEMMGFRNQGLVSLDFVAAETIERIQVLKGPSAAAQYGADSANGVILIYTKRGGR
jgi:iron complex outermembrane receptor protein